MKKEFETIATVGVINLENGAMNVVPGEVEIKVDIRSTSVPSRQRVLDHLNETIKAVKMKRNLEIVCTKITEEEPVMLSSEINNVFKMKCEERDLSYQFLQSGAGHDSMNMAKLCPTGLIFIPSVNGLSHHPNEFTEMDDVLTGINILEATVLHYAME